MFSFYKALVKNPRGIGAVSPSSKHLAAAIAASIPLPPSETGLIIELGGGTGVVTKAILNRGISEKQIIVIENSEVLAKKLLKRFPAVKIIHGTAAHLHELIGDQVDHVHSIVSGLPLLSLPKEVTEQILEQVRQTLKPGQHYIQFTYGLKKSILEGSPHYKKVGSKRIWLNIPPARIDIFELS